MRLWDQKRGFTLIELLVVVAVVVIVATIIFIALNPAQRFAESRNAVRWANVSEIAQAAHLYDIDNSIPIPGIDGTLRMIGTANSGCSVTCNGEEVASIPFDPFHINSAYAAGGGWVSPDSFTDAGNQWTNEANAIDGDTGTYATNTYGGTGWGQFIEVDFTTPITSDRLRVIVDYLDTDINAVDIDVYLDGAWYDAFQGGNEADWNVKWAEVSFPKGTVERARFRWNYAVSGYHYWMYEFQFYEAAAVPELPVCGSTSAGSIGESYATLSSIVGDDGGDPVEYRFEYGQTTSYGNATAWSGDYVTSDIVQSAISGLNGQTTYHYRASLRNSAGVTYCSDQSFITAGTGSGWNLAYTTSGTNWNNQSNSRDGSPSTFARAYHNIGQAQWSDFLTFDFADIYYDSMRFYALSGSLVSTIDIDFMIDGSWQDFYQGSFANRSWVEMSFTEEVVESVRVRFFATNASTGFFWEINELQLFETAASGDLSATSDACVDLSSVFSRYLPTIPFDPKTGSDARTYYAIQRDFGTKKITVKSCSAELGEEIQTSR